MEYTWYQFIWLFWIYSFGGWCLEVVNAAVKRKKFVNVGYLNSPFCVIYGFSAVAFAVFLPEIQNSLFFLFLGGVIIAGFIEYTSGKLLERIFGRKWWDYSDHRFHIGGYVCLETAMLWGVCAVIMVRFSNPLLLRLIARIPGLIGKICLWGIGIVIGLDAIGSSAAVFQMHYRLRKLALQVSYDMQRLSGSLGNVLTRRIQRRMINAYPNLSLEQILKQQKEALERERKENEASLVFAKGCSVYKLISLFFIGAFLGDIIETIFCYVTAGVWMSRSSVVYGPFSIVWGLGCVLLTAFLYPYRQKSDSCIFIAGTVLGGAYEYICSVVTELLFGTVFWDYSKIPFNLGGRINLLYCFFWGIVSVIWLKLCYPFLSRFIEQIPKKTGVIVCRVLVVFMVFDIGMSGLALARYSERQAGNGAVQSRLERYLDQHFPDEKMKEIYPNAKFV